MGNSSPQSGFNSMFYADGSSELEKRNSHKNPLVEKCISSLEEYITGRKGFYGSNMDYKTNTIWFKDFSGREYKICLGCNRAEYKGSVHDCKPIMNSNTVNVPFTFEEPYVACLSCNSLYRPSVGHFCSKKTWDDSNKPI